MKAEVRELLWVGGPVILTQILQMSLSFTDTIMAGRLSALDLAAVAIGSSVMMPVLVFCMASVLAVNPIVAQNLGGRRFHLIGKNVRQALWLSQMFALASFALVRNLDRVMVWMQVDPEIIPLASGYLDAISWGIFSLYGYVALRNFNEGLSVTRPPMFIALAGALVNVPANYVLMYGALGVPSLGAVGTGYASAIVWTVMFASMLLFTGRFRPYRRFSIFTGWRRPEWTYLSELLRVGLPIGSSATLEVSMFAVVGLLMGTLGTVAVAAHQIAINVAALAFMIPFGIAIAITSRVGHSVGRGNLEEARFRGWVGIGVCTGAMVVTALLMSLAPRAIVRVYTTDVDVMRTAVQLIFLAAIFQISDGIQVSGLGALRGLKDTRVPMLMSLLAYGVVGLPVAILLGIRLDWGPVGLWTGLIVGLTVAAALHSVRFRRVTSRLITSRTGAGPSEEAPPATAAPAASEDRRRESSMEDGLETAG